MTEFCINDCKEDDVIKKLLALKATLEYTKIFPNSVITQDFLLKTVVNPAQIGLFPQVETPESTRVYEDIREIATSLISPNSLNTNQILEIWQTFNIYTNERALKISLYGFSRIIKLLGSRGDILYKNIQQSISPIMIDHLSQDSQAQIRKGRALFNFFSETKLTNEDFHNLITNQKVFQNSSEFLLDYISNHWVPALKLTFKSLSMRADLLFPILIPILQKGGLAVKEKKLSVQEYISEFIECAMPLMGMISMIPSVENCQIIVKVYCVFLDFCKNLSIFAEGQEHIRKQLPFLNHVLDIIKSLLAQDRPVSIKREALNLIAMVWDYKHNFPGFIREIKPLLQDVQNMHFMTETKNLRPGKETTEFESLIKGFLELIRNTHDIEAVSLIFSLIREEDSGYDAEITHVLSKFIDDLLVKEPLGVFQDNFKEFLNNFFTPQIDRNVKNNLR